MYYKKNNEEGYIAPKTSFCTKEGIIFFGNQELNGETWKIYGTEHFEQRCRERQVGVNRGRDIFAAIITDVLFATPEFAQAVMTSSAARWRDDGSHLSTRLQIVDRINGVSIIVELNPRLREIMAVTVLSTDAFDSALFYRANINVVDIRVPEKSGDYTVSKILLRPWSTTTLRHVRSDVQAELDAECFDYAKCYYPEDFA